MTPSTSNEEKNPKRKEKQNKTKKNKQNKPNYVTAPPGSKITRPIGYSMLMKHGAWSISYFSIFQFCYFC